jgi:gas vesicle protein
MSDEKINPAGGLVAAFAVGALVGAGIALLYAPHSGRETRDLLVRKTRAVKETASNALHEAGGMVRHKKDQILAIVEAGKDAMENEGGKSRKAG